jgi:hypothetical protein
MTHSVVKGTRFVVTRKWRTKTHARLFSDNTLFIRDANVSNENSNNATVIEEVVMDVAAAASPWPWRGGGWGEFEPVPASPHLNVLSVWIGVRNAPRSEFAECGRSARAKQVNSSAWCQLENPRGSAPIFFGRRCTIIWQDNISGRKKSLLLRTDGQGPISKA